MAVTKRQAQAFAEERIPLVRRKLDGTLTKRGAARLRWLERAIDAYLAPAEARSLRRMERIVKRVEKTAREVDALLATVGLPPAPRRAGRRG